MEKQLLVLDKEIELLTKDNSVKGIMLIGSVSYGTANKYSDLDLIVLCDKDEFYTKEVDRITVELHYSKYETLLRKLESNPIEVYKYLYSKIILDNGSLKALIEKQPDYARNFKFSIIEVFLNKDDTSPYILEREKYWKSVFETGIFGYNKN